MSENASYVVTEIMKARAAMRRDSRGAVAKAHAAGAYATAAALEAMASPAGARRDLITAGVMILCAIEALERGEL